MASAPARTTTEPTGGAPRLSWVNGALLAGGLVAVAAGYALLARGSIVAAPLLLVLGYAVLLPWGLSH